MESTRPIRALIRGLDALTVLNLRDGATVSEVAHDIRLPRTTVYRILETLTESGFVLRDPADERYRITVRVKDLSTGFEDEPWVRDIAQPQMDSLVDEIAWPLHLCCLSGSRLTVLAATHHATALAVERHSQGTSLSLLSTSAGRAFLAFCPAARRDALLDLLSHSKREEDQAARNLPEFKQLLAEIQAQGYATVSRTRRLIDELSLSVPVIFDDRPLAILTVRFVASAMPLKSGIERFLPRLRQCAARIVSQYAQRQGLSQAQSSPGAAV